MSSTCRVGAHSRQILLAIAGCLSQLGCGDRPISLPIADVPVKPLNTHRPDPTVEFPEQFPMQVAVLWTNPDEPGLGLQHTLTEMGIPFFWTRDLDRALNHPQVLLYPYVDAKTFTATQAGRLTAYVQNGGIVFAQNVLWGGLRPLFGFADCRPSHARHHVSFKTGEDVIFKYLDRPEEQTAPLGSDSIQQIFWTNGYAADPAARVLATFEDSSAALLVRTLGKGKCYLSGVGLDDVTIRNQANRDFEAQRRYANGFEPGTDIWMLILRAWYENYAANWVRLAPIPDGKRSVLLLSHDLDSAGTLSETTDYLDMEKRNGVTSTLFVQTKYINNAIGPALFRPENIALLQKAKAEGFDLESHSVSHALNFNKFLEGTGQETLATYHTELAFGGKEYNGGTAFGEVKISKGLLDGVFTGQHTIFFRAGHLRVPPSLPDVLVRCGYLFDSSFTADDVLSNFPYALPLGLGTTDESGVYEFPVTMEDEEAPGLAGHVASDLDLIEANAANGGINVLLVHPADPSHKVPAEEEIIRRRPAGVSVSDMLTFARFWRAREGVHWTVEPGPAPCRQCNPLDLQIRLVPGEPVKGLTFEFQCVINAADGLDGLRIDQNRLILPSLRASQEYLLHVHCSHSKRANN